MRQDSGTKIDRERFKGQQGFALVAAMLIMFMILTLGILAMATSMTETRLVTNEGEADLMFFYAEQVADRVINHFYYRSYGPYGVLRIDPDQVSDQISAIRVVEDAGVLEVDDSSVEINSDLQANAWVDMRDWEGPHDRRLSNDMYIDVKLEVPSTNFARAFRFKVSARAWWDYAWFTYYWTPYNRFRSSHDCYVGSSHNDDYHLLRNCTETFNTGDTITGDVYLSVDRGNNRRPLFRGWPRIVGEVSWRQPDDFHFGTLSGVQYQNSRNQSLGGSRTEHHPVFTRGIVESAQTNAGPSYGAMVTSTSTTWLRRNADLILEKPAADTAYRILFRNDLDTSDPTCNWAGGLCNYEFNSRVASAITPSINDGVAQDPNDKGIMMVWRIPFDKTDINDLEAAFYGDTAARRHAKMIAQGGEIWTSGASWISGNAKSCDGTRANTSGGATFRPYDTEDVMPGFDFLYVPSRDSTISGCSGTRTGIIVVYGDAIVSGIVDGSVTLIATGDIYLDHEIEYEQSPIPSMPESYTDPDDIDMLMLVAGGRIVIPQSYPKKNVLNQHEIYLDDWSDAQNGTGWFQPTGNYDHHADPITDDDGSEDIQAMLVSFGRFCTVGTGSVPTVSCISPYSTASLTSAQRDELEAFRSGFYAMPRTFEGTSSRPNPFLADPWTGTPYLDGANAFVPMANQSGTLRIVGSVYQYYPGRLNYDFYTAGVSGSSACTNGQTYSNNEIYNEIYNPSAGGGEPQPVTDGCNLMGFEMVNVVHDPRLKYAHPPFSVDKSGTGRGIPYGNGDYRIVSWEPIGVDDAGCLDHAGNCW
ncbi:MAG: pilus assembly PilX N-terminal domain-containing protein [Candidatus Alcyoniella australis]|nr:pilus assembly PilX N-terminal domain-containing protein [Candidatus Alcyoniella australis]